eukprot:351810-Chlamydomonas_euryale.AAC.4
MLRSSRVAARMRLSGGHTRCGRARHRAHVPRLRGGGPRQRHPNGVGQRAKAADLRCPPPGEQNNTSTSARPAT